MTGAEVLDGSIKGVDIDITTLSQVGSAATADRAGNADRFGNRPPESYVQQCAPGSVMGFVRIAGSSTYPASWTEVSGWNCGQDKIFARRLGQGNYEISLRNNPAALGLLSVSDSEATSTVVYLPAGTFRVQMLYQNSGFPRDAAFSLLVI